MSTFSKELSNFFRSFRNISVFIFFRSTHSLVVVDYTNRNQDIIKMRNYGDWDNIKTLNIKEKCDNTITFVGPQSTLNWPLIHPFTLRR